MRSWGGSPYKRESRELPTPSTMWGHGEEEICLRTKKQVLTRHWIFWHLNIGLLSLYKCENLLFLDETPPVYGSLLWQPEWTKTAFMHGYPVTGKEKRLGRCNICSMARIRTLCTGEVCWLQVITPRRTAPYLPEGLRTVGTSGIFCSQRRTESVFVSLLLCGRLFRDPSYAEGVSIAFDGIINVKVESRPGRIISISAIKKLAFWQTV